MIILGRASVAEFVLVSTTEPVAYGPTRHPWDLESSPGGSSGGSDVAVSSGMVPIAQGTDGGCIRMPACHCGVFGLKVSRGRISAGPRDGHVLAANNGLGFLTRTKRDSARALDLAAGPETGDPVVAPPPARRFEEEFGAPHGALRIGVIDVVEVNGFAADTECHAVLCATADLMETLDHHVVSEFFPDAMIDADYLDGWVDLLSPSVTALLEELEALAGQVLTDDDVGCSIARYWCERGSGIAAQNVKNEIWRDDYRRRMAGWWASSFDPVLTPILLQAPPLGWFDRPEGLRRSIEMPTFTPQFNTTGQPAASIPLGQTAEGLPIGVQFVASYGREALLLGLASQLETAAPWSDRRFPVHA